MSQEVISVLICTRDRCESLVHTLDSILKQEVPEGCKLEILIVDNASKDATREVVQSLSSGNPCLRYIYESRPGKSFAYNRGIQCISGEVTVLTDDDVRPAEEWLKRLVSPIRAGVAKASVGSIVLSSELRRTWQTDRHLRILADTTTIKDEDKILIGAGCAIQTRLLKDLGFDTELGPGQLGLGEDMLLTLQIREAKHRIVVVPEAIAVHHPMQERLERKAFLEAAAAVGRSYGYRLWHWEGRTIRAATLLYWLTAIKLWLFRLLHPLQWNRIDGADETEMSYIQWMSSCKQMIYERKRNRRYRLVSGVHRRVFDIN